MTEDMVETLESRTDTEVLSHERTTDGIEIEASTQESYDLALRAFGGAYAGVVDNYDADDPLRAEVYVAQEDQSYLIQAEAEWGKAFFNDEISESEYISRINQETVEVS